MLREMFTSQPVSFFSVWSFEKENAPPMLASKCRFKSYDHALGLRICNWFKKWGCGCGWRSQTKPNGYHECPIAQCDATTNHSYPSQGGSFPFSLGQCCWLSSQRLLLKTSSRCRPVTGSTSDETCLTIMGARAVSSSHEQSMPNTDDVLFITNHQTHCSTVIDHHI